MSNGFTDFFETLLPREITIYVLPGSLVLSTILWWSNCYLYKVNCKPESATYIFDKVICHSSATGYTILGIIWIAIAYTIGLIIGAIKQGILYSCIRNYARGLKLVFDARWEKKFYCIKIILGCRPNKKDSMPLKTNKYSESHFSAMYISLRQEKMYRREIERYGVFANVLDHLAIALGFVLLSIATKPVDIYFTGKDKLLGVILSLFLLLLLPIGAEGYRKLQSDRIRYLKKAIET